MIKKIKKYALSIAVVCLGGITFFLLLNRVSYYSKTVKYLEQPMAGDLYLLRDMANKDYLYLSLQSIDGNDRVFMPSMFAYATVLAAQHAQSEKTVEFNNEVRFTQKELKRLYQEKALLSIER